MLMLNPLLIQTTLAAVLIYLLGWIIYCRYFHPLHSIPGPFLASISRAWIVFKTMMGDMERTQRALHKKHGDCYQWANIVCYRLTRQDTLFALLPTRLPALILKPSR